MRVLVTGATGLIGAAVVARLRAEGRSVVAVVRRGGRRARALGAERVLSFDLGRSPAAQDWAPHLADVDAVVNCVGVLQDGSGDSVAAAHAQGPAALFAACEAAGVRRVIHFSAIGVDVEQPTAFSRSKREGEQALVARDLDWVILRPSVVVGRTAYGGSALMRGLAALPVLPVMPGSGPLQIVQLDDVTRTVAFFVSPSAPARLSLDLAGPERLTFTDAVLAYRRWLGWAPPRLVHLPGWAASAFYKLGDLAGLLGWRPPIRTTAQREIVRGAVGDPRPWREVTGINPTSLSAALAAEPAGVQERWFASLYFLKPLGFAVFAAFWIMTGLVSLGPGWIIGKGLMFQGGVADPLATLAVVSGALADIVIGCMIAWRRTARPGLWAAFAISIAYIVIGTWLLPQLWREPLGPMMKIWPILVFNLMLLAILRDR